MGPKYPKMMFSTLSKMDIIILLRQRHFYVIFRPISMYQNKIPKKEGDHSTYFWLMIDDLGNQKSRHSFFSNLGPFTMVENLSKCLKWENLH